MKTYKVLFNQRGMSLVEVMVAIAISALVSLGMMRINETGIRSTNRATTDLSLTMFRTATLEMNLAKPEICEANFQGDNGAAASVETQLVNDAAVVFATSVAPNNFTADRDWRIDRITRQAFVASTVGGTSGRCDLTIQLTRNKMSFGSQTKTLTIPIFCQVDGANLITTCMAASGNSDSIWTLVYETGYEFANYNPATSGGIVIGPDPTATTAVTASIEITQDGFDWGFNTYQTGVKMPADNVVTWDKWAITEDTSAGNPCYYVIARNSSDSAINTHQGICRNSAFTRGEGTTTFTNTTYGINMAAANETAGGTFVSMFVAPDSPNWGGFTFNLRQDLTSPATGNLYSGSAFGFNGGVGFFGDVHARAHIFTKPIGVTLTNNFLDTHPYFRHMFNNNGYSMGVTVDEVGTTENNITGTHVMAVGTANTSSGTQSVAIGANSYSDALRSFAIGSYAVADGDYSFAKGVDVLASGLHSQAFGNLTAAQGPYSTAIGNSSNAMGDYSMSVGLTNQALGRHSFSFGLSNVANAQFGVALGNTNTVSASNGTAIGYGNTANSTYATAIGYANTVAGSYSMGVGRGLDIDRTYQYVFGYANDKTSDWLTPANNIPIFAVAGGSVTTTNNCYPYKRNLMQVYNSGATTIEASSTKDGAADLIASGSCTSTTEGFTFSRPSRLVLDPPRAQDQSNWVNSGAIISSNLYRGCTTADDCRYYTHNSTGGQYGYSAILLNDTSSVTWGSGDRGAIMFAVNGSAATVNQSRTQYTEVAPLALGVRFNIGASALDAYSPIVMNGRDIVMNNDRTTVTTATSGGGHIGMARGNIYQGGMIEYTSLVNESDRALKSNIQHLNKYEHLEKILSLAPARYHYKIDKEKKERFGLIAQDVKTVYPEIVSGADKDNKYLKLNYVDLISPIISSIQALYEKIKELFSRSDELEQRLNEIENRLLSLEEENKALKLRIEENEKTPKIMGKNE